MKFSCIEFWKFAWHACRKILKRERRKEVVYAFIFVSEKKTIFYSESILRSLIYLTQLYRIALYNVGYSDRLINR